MLSTIRARLTLSHLALVVLAMGLAGFLLLTLLQRYFLQAMEDSLVAQARITAQALIPGTVAVGPAVEAQDPAYNTLQTIQQRSNIAVQAENALPPAEDFSLSNLDLTYLAEASLQLSTQLDTRIRILDAQGVVWIDSAREQQGVNLGDDVLVAQALVGRYASRTERDRQTEQPAMHVAVPVLLEGQLAGVVYLSQALQDMTIVLGDLRNFWLLSTGIALLLSGGAGLLLSRTLSQPLHRLTEAAEAVAQGRLDQQVQIHSRDELGRLSASFNEMTARLRASRQMQVDFVANVSHELRTPLTSIKGMLETLRDGAVDDPQVRDRFLETAETETDRLIRLVNDLMLLSRVDSEALELRRQELDLADLVHAAVEQLAHRAEAKDLMLQVQAGPDLPPAWGDPDRIVQVLVNLLDNAIKYSHPGGTVSICLEGEAGRPLQVQVRDEGIGIPTEALGRIGRRFYRVDRARSRAEGGSGLGLAIARSLVQSHGGRLWVESQEGKGTVVVFTLPSR